jgi:hypothetical protein
LCLSDGYCRHRVVFEKEGGKEYGFLFFGRKVVAVLYVGAVECIGHV